MSSIGNSRKYRVQKADHNWFEENINCQWACPVHTKVPEYIMAILKNDYNLCYEINQEANVFPEILGRVCAKYCQYACRRRKLDNTVYICNLKRVGAAYRTTGEKNKVRKFHETAGKAVGIIGAGPSGLTVAYNLASTGYKVTIYEALCEPGGMLRVGIPEFRLPRDIIDKAVKDIAQIGVTIKYNTPVGVDIQLKDLVKEFNAVVIAGGAHKPKKLLIPGEGSPDVLHGVTFMREICLGKRKNTPKKIAVIGGGHTAVDCARSSLRLGAEKIYMLYRRGREEIPVTPEELEEVEKEGIDVRFLVSPVEIILGENQKVISIRCIKNKLGEPDSSGRRKPVPIEGSEFEIEADMVVPAVSQEPDMSFISKDLELALNKWDALEVDEKTGMTSMKGVFAVGDFAWGPQDVIKVIEQAHQVSRGIDVYLRGKEQPDPRRTLMLVPEWKRYRTEYDKQSKINMPTIPRADRTDMKKEVELGYSKSEANAEATRCFFCNHNIMIDPSRCILCNGCIDVCPYYCIRMVSADNIEGLDCQGALDLPENSAKRYAMIIDEEICIRCGLCIKRCPTNAITMEIYKTRRS